MNCICGHKEVDHYSFMMHGQAVSECGHDDCPCMGFKDEERYGIDLDEGDPE